MNSKVKVDRAMQVMVITIDNPPINAGSVEVRQGLLAAINELQSDSQLVAGVMIGAGATFIAGSDLKEFSLPLAEPHLPAVILAIENCPKPVVAAIHGAALGGGFELALGCDARIALESAILGLPEVTLGIIPGAGGTQRLPRLVGVEKSIELICSGARIKANTALGLGIVTQVVKADLLTHAITLAQSLAGRKSKVRDRVVPQANPATIAQVIEQALKAGKNRPQVQKAIEMICYSQNLDIDQALQIERETFQDLRISTEAKALRHQFFAERKLFKALNDGDTKSKDVHQVAVIGAGTMGSGIAIACLNSGYSVVLLDQNQHALESGEQRIKQFFEARLKSAKIDQALLNQVLERFSTSSDWGSIANAQLVIEAVFEDINVKHEVFEKLDSYADKNALLATNTSYLDIDAIATKTNNPARVFGLHFFSPAHVMKLIEIVKGKDTSATTVAAGLSFAKRLGKTPIISANAFGFIGNRIYSAYRRQCEFMLEEGAYPDQIDKALENYGFAMGPFAVADMSGLDIAWSMRKSLAAARNPQHRYVSIPDTLCLQGRFGRKTGAGYYLYAKDSKVGLPDPVVNRIVEEASAAKGIVRRKFTDEEVVNRAILAMINEIAHLVAERVVQDVTDCDIALVHGYGFPRWRGGPVFIAQQMGENKLKTEFLALANVSGPGFVLANPDVLLKTL